MSERMEAHAALKQSARAAKRGDLAAAERWSKTAERLAATVDRLAALPPPPADYEEEERLRDELMRRIQRIADVANDVREWEVEKAVHEALVAHGVDAPPLRPHPHDMRTLIPRLVREPEPDDELMQPK